MEGQLTSQWCQLCIFMFKDTDESNVGIEADLPFLQELKVVKYSGEDSSETPRAKNQGKTFPYGYY